MVWLTKCSMSLGAERIGLPPYAWWNEALHGVAASPGVSFNRTGGPFSHATSFANTITLSAAFDDDLVYKVADVISTEARAFANAGLAGLDYWTPNINPYKDPRWGRGHETPGEDPVRIKGYTKSLLAGLEGNSTIRKVIATCKHFAAYDLERWKGAVRHRFNAVVSSQDLSEYYLPPFQQCARDSKVGSIMCSYNALNGTPACASEYLMTDILRNHWNWTADNNFITSDCNAVQDFLPFQHNFSQTPAEAAAVALKAGTDTVCEVPSWPPLTDILGAYNQSLLSESTIDRALNRLYEGLIRAGYFDPASASPYRSIGWSSVNTPQAQALALQTAVDGIVLLKNDGTLPIRDLRTKRVALVGHWVFGGSQMLGGYSGFPPYLVPPVVAAQGLGLSYTTAVGPVSQELGNNSWVEDARRAAEGADVVVYFGGTDLGVAAEGVFLSSFLLSLVFFPHSFFPFLLSSVVSLSFPPYFPSCSFPSGFFPSFRLVLFALSLLFLPHRYILFFSLTYFPSRTSFYFSLCLPASHFFFPLFLSLSTPIFHNPQSKRQTNTLTPQTATANPSPTPPPNSPKSPPSPPSPSPS